MTHTYSIFGITCTGCQKTIQGLLSKVDGVKKVATDLSKGTADIEMEKHISTETLKSALQDTPKYQLSESIPTAFASAPFEEEEKRSWFETYKPIIFLFAYISAISIIAAFSGDNFNILHAMRVFMAGFFITFSFFKMLDLNGLLTATACMIL